MDSQKQQVAERIKQSNNILVTVSSNPSVDQLSACIGLTLALNKMGKHATAVFSGVVPSTLEFLQPEKTIEKNTDSLRDFIISLDKSKADKLRYKVEDKVVKIFITPYRTSISEKDLDFSQGDFNVDVVLALGVHQQSDLDQAITSHGRILHDATVATINVRPGGDLGSINWLDVNASSLSELTVQLVNDIDKSLLDGQIATAMLTGIVAETDRFSNAKTSPQTMSISAALMTAGANQQLVATKLQEPVKVPEPAPAPIQAAEGEKPAEQKPDKDTVSNDGTLEISHDPNAARVEAPKSEDQPAPEPEKPEVQAPEIHIDETGALRSLSGEQEEVHPSISHHSEAPKMIIEPPTMGGQLTANSSPEELSPSTDPLTLPAVNMPLLGRDNDYGPTQAVAPTILPPSEGVSTPAPLPSLDATDEPIAPISEVTLPDLPLPSVTPYQAMESEPAAPVLAPQPVLVPVQPVTVAPTTTLSELENQLHSEHVQQQAPPAQPPMPEPSFSLQQPTEPITPPAADADNGLSELEKARTMVEQAMAANGNQPLEPIHALNAQPLEVPGAQQNQTPDATTIQPTQPVVPDWNPNTPLPEPSLQPLQVDTGVPVQPSNPATPPSSPPPMMPPMPPYQQ